jgi:hypothetical protein
MAVPDAALIEGRPRVAASSAASRVIGRGIAWTAELGWIVIDMMIVLHVVHIARVLAAEIEGESFFQLVAPFFTLSPGIATTEVAVVIVMVANHIVLVMNLVIVLAPLVAVTSIDTTTTALRQPDETNTIPACHRLHQGEMTDILPRHLLPPTSHTNESPGVESLTSF